MKKETTIEFENQKALTFLDNSLCRYRFFDDKGYAIEALKNDKLYFSTPGVSFNDPFDNLIYANPRKILFRICRNIMLNMDDYIDGQRNENPAWASWADFKFHGAHKKQFLSAFIEECESKIEQFKKDLLNNTRIICFSELYDSMLMWSHYADHHKGFALIYDKESILSADAYSSEDELISKKPLLLPVRYVDKQIDLTNDINNHLFNHLTEKFVQMPQYKNFKDLTPLDKDISQANLRQSIMEKSPDWKYEKEWRLIPRYINLEKESNLCYLKIKPKAVIIGALCSEEDSITLFNICKENEIPLFDIRINEWEPGYKLHVSTYEHQ